MENKLRETEKGVRMIGLLSPPCIWASDEHVAVSSPQQAGATPQQWQEAAWLVDNLF